VQKFQKAIKRNVFERKELVVRATDKPLESRKACEWGLHLHHRNSDIMHLIYCPMARPPVIQIEVEDFRGRIILSGTYDKCLDWHDLLKEVRILNDNQENKLDERYRQLKEKNMS